MSTNWFRFLGCVSLCAIVVGCGATEAKPSVVQKPASTAQAAERKAAGPRGKFKRRQARGRNKYAQPQGRRSNSGMQERTIMVDGRERFYMVYVPNSYAKSKAAPLMVLLHGGKHSARSSARKRDVRRAADEHGFLVAYGQGGRRGSKKGRGYSWHGVNLPGEQHIDEVKYVAAMLDDIGSRYNVDEKHIGAVGFSNGGMMAHRLGGELSDRLAMIVSVSSYLGGQLELPEGKVVEFGPPQPKAPISVMMINNRDDPKVPYNGGKAQSIERKSAAQALAFWAKANRCPAKPEITTAPKRGAEKQRYDCRQTGTEVILYSFDRGGHKGPRKIEGKPRAIVWYELLMRSSRT